MTVPCKESVDQVAMGMALTAHMDSVLQLSLSIRAFLGSSTFLCSGQILLLLLCLCGFVL